MQRSQNDRVINTLRRGFKSKLFSIARPYHRTTQRFAISRTWALRSALGLCVSNTSLFDLLCAYTSLNISAVLEQKEQLTQPSLKISGSFNSSMSMHYWFPSLADCMLITFFFSIILPVEQTQCFILTKTSWKFNVGTTAGNSESKYDPAFIFPLCVHKILQ